MKKLAVASTVLAALTTSAAFASVSVDAYNDYNFDSRKNKQGIELGYSPIENLGLTAEVTTDKDLDLGVAYKFDIAENYYVKPSLGYVAKWDDKEELEFPFSKDNNGINMYSVGHNSNILKVGLEAGAQFGDFFASARYRYERDMDKSGVEFREFNAGNLKETRTYTTRGAIGRTDLMIGYNFANTVTVTAKGIHRSQLNNDIREDNNFWNDADKYISQEPQLKGVIGQTPNSFWTSEVKATLTSIDGVLPYVQYARNYETRDDMVKVGAKFVF